ncbi:MAG: pyridoxal phosphate-dependent class II aminotransferase [Cellvibrionaceae bacterium]|nr:pyridoxal phosphate-dependent class II aminotransferase [Cellvibrionaceae bacterium]
MKVLHHGGRLREIAEQYRRPRQQWLDLSTGISPWAWPVPSLPEAVWRELPDDGDQLAQTAQRYYGTAQLPLPVPGSQWAIRQLPALLSPLGPIAVPSWGYQEHRHAWQLAGYQCCEYPDLEWLQQAIANGDINPGLVVAINPNNPSAETRTGVQMRALAKLLAERECLLIVDEAFADSCPANSVLGWPLADNVVVLRSLGKFFGLAGLRLGFVFGPPDLQRAMAQMCQPWGVNGPARFIARRCLADTAWVAAQRARLHSSSIALAEVLAPLNLQQGRSDYFVSLSGPAAELVELNQYLLQRGVYARAFAPQHGLGRLRLGLCRQLEKLDEVVRAYG